MRRVYGGTQPERPGPWTRGRIRAARTSRSGKVIGRPITVAHVHHYGLAIAAALAVLTSLLVLLAPRPRPTAEQVAAATA